MASLGRLTIDMVANLGGFERDMGRADRVTRKAMGNVRRELRSAERDMAKAQASLKNLGMQFAALAGISIGVVVREFRSLAQQADRLDKLAAGTGASVEAIQRLGFAAEQSGSSMEVLVKGLTTMQRNLQGASDNLTTYQRALERIGISHSELLDLDPEQQFLRIADALNKTENSTVRSATAQEIFGRAGRELLAMFDSGVGTIEDWSAALESTGAIMSTQMASDFARFNDQMNLLGRQFTGLKVQIFGDLIEPMADFVEFLNSETGTESLKQAMEDIGRAAEIVGIMIGVRMVGQLLAYTYQLGVATIAAAQHTIALAKMGTGATVASGQFAALGIATRTMLGPLGLLVTGAALVAPAFFRVKDSFEDSKNEAEDLSGEIARLTSNMDDLRKAEIERVFTKFREQASKTRQALIDVKSEIAKIEQETSDTGFLNPAIIDLRQEEERLTKVLNEQIDTLNELKDAYDNVGKSTKDLNDEMARNELAQFRRGMEDLAASLGGAAAQAMLQFERNIESVYEALNNGLPFQEAMIALALFRQEYEQTLAGIGGGGGGAGDLGSALANAISISDGRNVGESIGNAIKTFGVQGITEGLQGAFETALGELDVDSAEMQGYMVAIGEAIGGNVGAAIGTAVGTAIGAALGGPLGAQIGATIGNAIGTLLDPQKDPKFQIGGTSGFAATGGMPKGSFETIFGQQLFRFRGIEDAVADQIKTALVEFDNAIASFITDETQLSAITAALRQFGFDSQDEAASVQELLQRRFDAVLGTFDSFTQEIVRQAFGLEDQVNRLAELQMVQRQMLFTGTMGAEDGNALIRQIASMQRGTETLVDTFNRFTVTMGALNQLADLLNVNLKGGTQGIRVFADELLRVFGDDMQKFQASMSKIFDTFFDTTEVIEAAATAERTRATRLLEGLGVAVTDATFTAEGFRQLFENLFPTLDAQDAAILIEAGVAVATLIDYESQLTDARRDQAGVLTQLTAEGEAFAQAMIATEESIALAPLNAFQREMVGIQRNLYRTINAINQAAGSAITQEAAERALARAHEAAAIQAAAAVARLEASTLRLVQQVFGTPLDEINRQIAELERNSNGVADAIGNAASAMEDLIAFADSLLVGNLSPLPSRERLSLGLEQLRAASAAGDVQAVQSLAQQVLQIGRERFASGPEFAQLFQEVQDIIRGTTPADDTQQVTVVESPMLEALFRERDAINAEIAAADRRANATDIAQAIADISLATGKSFEEVARDLGVPLADLAKILGLDMAGLDTLLKSMMVDTDSLAKTLETYAKEIRDAILQMTNAILEALGKQAQEPTAQEMFEDWVAKNPQKPGPVVVGIVDEMIPIDEPAPPPPPAGGGAPPAPYVPPQDPPDSKIPEDSKQPMTFADLLFGKDVVRNTKETTEAINRLTDAIVKSNTRSSRTALA